MRRWRGRTGKRFGAPKYPGWPYADITSGSAISSNVRRRVAWFVLQGADAASKGRGGRVRRRRENRGRGKAGGNIAHPRTVQYVKVQPKLATTVDQGLRGPDRRYTPTYRGNFGVIHNLYPAAPRPQERPSNALHSSIDAVSETSLITMRIFRKCTGEGPRETNFGPSNFLDTSRSGRHHLYSSP